MARPLKDEPKLTRTYSFKTTEALGELWDYKIAQSGLRKSEFFRLAVEQNQTTVVPSKHPYAPRPKRSIDEQKILFLLSKQSNNINQIAHSINSARTAGIVSAQLYQDVLDKLDVLVEIAEEWRP
jgi:hypothetical protein